MSCRACTKARAKVDLPAPRSPASAIRSPGRTAAASRRARFAVAPGSGRESSSRGGASGSGMRRPWPFPVRPRPPASGVDKPSAPVRLPAAESAVLFAATGVAMSSPAHTTDVAIIGAGPVGLFAIFELGMLKIRCHVVDSLEMVGGQCVALYPEKPIYDIPGYPRIEAADLIHRLVEQAAPFEPVYHLGQRVEAVRPDGAGGWIVETAAGTRINARAVIIAAGVGAFGPNRPPLPGIEEYEG